MLTSDNMSVCLKFICDWISSFSKKKWRTAAILLIHAEGESTRKKDTASGSCVHLCILKKSEIFCKQTFWVLLCFHTKKNLSLRYGVNGIETDDSKANKIKQTKSKRKNSFDDKDVCELFFNTEQKATTRENETMSHH